DRVGRVEDAYWREQKTCEIKELILACGGIWFEGYAPMAKFALGEDVPIKMEFIVRRPGVEVVVGNETLPFNELHEQSDVFVADRITQPYWLHDSHGLGSFTVINREDVGRPDNHDAPKISVTLRINGKVLDFECPVVHKYTHPVRGEVYEPLTVAPPITANVGQKALVFNGGEPKTLEVVFAAHTQQKVSAIGSLQLPEGWRAEPQ